MHRLIGSESYSRNKKYEYSLKFQKMQYDLSIEMDLVIRSATVNKSSPNELLLISLINGQYHTAMFIIPYPYSVYEYIITGRIYEMGYSVPHVSSSEAASSDAKNILCIKRFDIKYVFLD